MHWFVIISHESIGVMIGDEVSTRRCLLIVDLELHGNTGQVKIEGGQANKGV
jgi:hypothetical protein